jgi:hypothetical protein
LKRLLVIVSLVAACLGVAACGSTPPSSSPTTRPAATGPVAPASSGGAPEASAEAGPEFVGAFAPITLKGKGDMEQATFEIPEDAIAIATLSHPSKGPFIVTAYDEDGVVTKQLVKTNGKYGGTVLFDLQDHSVYFRVQSKGSWKITIKPAEAAKAWDGAKATKGKGDQVLRLTNPTVAGIDLQLKASGTAPYVVRAHSPEDDIDLMEGAGPGKVAKELPEGTDLLEIVGRGAWQLALATDQ